MMNTANKSECLNFMVKYYNAVSSDLGIQKLDSAALSIDDCKALVEYIKTFESNMGIFRTEDDPIIVRQALEAVNEIWVNNINNNIMEKAYE